MSSLSPDRPNFFDLLDLDPDDPWEYGGRQRYESQLKTMRARWERIIEAPGKPGEEAKRNLALLRREIIQDVMEERSKREAEARDCLAGRAERRTHLEALLRDWKKGADSVSRQQITLWAGTMGLTSTDVELAALSVGLEIPVDSTVRAAPRPVKARLDPHILQDIRIKLQTLSRLDPVRSRRYETLYTFLGLHDSASADTLQRAAQTMYADLNCNINRTELLTAQTLLCGQAISIFNSDYKKNLYDEALYLEPLERLLEEMTRKTGGARPPETYIQAYYADALRAGFGQDDAQEELEYWAQRRKWGLTAPPTASRATTAPMSGHPRVFVSHSHADDMWCGQLVNALASSGIDVWFDKQGLFVGDQWIPKLQSEVEGRDVFLIVLSADAWSSPWVQKEFQLALHRNKRIIGVIHRPVTLSGFILTYQILDAIGQDAAQVARQVVERLKA